MWWYMGIWWCYSHVVVNQWPLGPEMFQNRLLVWTGVPVSLCVWRTCSVRGLLLTGVNISLSDQMTEYSIKAPPFLKWNTLSSPIPGKGDLEPFCFRDGQLTGRCIMLWFHQNKLTMTNFYEFPQIQLRNSSNCLPSSPRLGGCESP